MLSTGALVGLAYINGHGLPKDGSFLDGVLQAITNPGVAVVLAFLALVVAVWCFRQLWTEWLAWWPGGIEVGDFVAGSKLTDADVAQLTMRFRQRLATLHLRAPTPAPGAPAGSDFLDVVGRGGVDSRNILGSVLSVFRAARPRHAWQINGVLVERDESPRYGVTVQVIRLPNEGSPPATVWTRDWDRSVRCAADRATAAILTRTRLCRTPWATWRRYVMPGELFEAYEAAVEFERARRYDEALDSYYRASGMDPSNLALRLHIGMLQEKLGLFLDALSTYQGISAIHKEEQLLEERRLRQLLYRVAEGSERRRAELVARYRRDLLLGGSELAEQWQNTGPSDKSKWNARDKRREELRGRLRLGLAEELTKLGDRDRDRLLSEPPPSDDNGDEQREAAIYARRRLFANAALADLKRVRRRVGWRFRDRRLVLSSDSVKLTRLCIQNRLDWVNHKLEGEPHPGWAPVPEKLDRQVRRTERPFPFDRWEEHYNAACVYAVPLLVSEDDVQELEAAWLEELAGRAVQRLTYAAACADSSYIARQREWLLSEDPDLDGLRRHALFKAFEATYFPAAAPTPHRPRHVQKLELSRYIRGLMVQTAKRWEDEWHKRGRNLDSRREIHTLLDWWNDEFAAWELVQNVAENHRHWSARLMLINKMEEWADIHRFEPLDVSVSRYEDRPLNGEDDAAAYKSLKAADARLRRVASALPCADGGPGPEALREIARWQSALRQLDAQGRGPSQLVIGILCDQHAALWQRFREWITAKAYEEGQRERAFKRQMDDAKRWWCSARHWWRTPVLLVDVANRTMPGRRPHPVARKPFEPDRQRSRSPS